LQTPRLSALFAESGVQVPRADASAQLRHAPPQAELQHTPSTQNPDAQSDAWVQTPPLVFLPQLPLLMQAMPGAQSEFVVHFVLQAPPLHAKGMHSSTPWGLQVPWPSQVPGVLRRVPAHDGSTHTVSGAYFAHAPKPSQAPVCPHFVAPLSLQICRGSGTP
jgi:hypothetical protein